MPDIIRETTDEMIPPDEASRDAAIALSGDQDVNDELRAAWPCLNTIEACPPAAKLPPPTTLTIAAWNMERCKRVEDSADLIRASGADIVLATEMDHGMARSDQRHTTRDLARLLGFGYVFGTEFVELGTGDAYETGLFADTPNQHGLHGNAILSRYPLKDPAMLPVEDGGTWFVGAPKDDGQLRIGGRMAIAAQVKTAGGKVTLASVHFESQSDADGRAEQTKRLLKALDKTYDEDAAVIGGDLNTKALAEAGLDRAAVLATPEGAEPCFARFAKAGFGWQTANTGWPTTRAAPGRPVSYPLKSLDWMFTRSVSASDARVIAAVSPRGDYLSDHELIIARIAP
ncbi:endonuclease/exonuclease/phosphatase family protein [Halovulum sp. GXIMD14793]